MLLPTTLPTAKPGAPSKAERMEISNSGAEVPKATMVSPIIKWGIFRRTARDTAPRTNASPPIMSIASPAIRKRYDIEEQSPFQPTLSLQAYMIRFFEKARAQSYQILGLCTISCGKMSCWKMAVGVFCPQFSLYKGLDFRHPALFVIKILSAFFLFFFTSCVTCNTKAYLSLIPCSFFRHLRPWIEIGIKIGSLNCQRLLTKGFSAASRLTLFDFVLTFIFWAAMPLNLIICCFIFFADFQTSQNISWGIS